ncbi:hypothetical protein EI94DRAFT_868577 [Lactarius quietus]|nr:hypothetical protein EI94DRAFT_868577 [Lactarius quietus]
MGDRKQQVEASLHETNQWRWRRPYRGSTYTCPEFLLKIKVNNNEQHGAFSIGERELRPSFDIELRAKNVTLSLPRFFRGIVTINSPYHRIVLSPAFVERAALLSDVPDVRVYFVGVRPRSWMLWSDDDNGKVGEETAVAGRCPEEPLDKVVVTSSGLGSGVRIRWEGEPELPE